MLPIREGKTFRREPAFCLRESPLDFLVVFIRAEESFAMSLALLGHDMQLASADYVSLFDLLVSCVDAHGFEPVLDLECFEVQGVRQLRAVSNPHAVRPLALVTQVVGMRATHLKGASVIFMQQHVSRPSCRAAWFIIIIIVISISHRPR